MGFDWRAFAEGFATTAAANITEKKKEARKYEAEQDQLAKDNIMKISRRNSVVNEVLGLTNYLEDQGVSTAQMQAAISSGPQAIQDLSTKVKAAVEANGGRPLGDSDLDMIIKMPEGFKPLDMDMDKYVRNTYGLGLETKGATTEKPDISFFDRLTGDSAMTRAKYKLGSDVIYDGYTAEDINMLARQQEYEALQPSTYSVIADLKRFDLKAKKFVLDSIVSLKKDREELDPEYSAALTALEALDERGGLTQLESDLETSPDNENIKAQIAKYKAAQNKVKSIEMPLYQMVYDDAIDTYGLAAFEDLETSMLANVGEEYVQDLRELLSPTIKQSSEALGAGSAVDAETIEALGEVPTEPKKLFKDINFTVTKTGEDGKPTEVKTDGGNTYTPESEGWDVLVQHLDKKETPVGPLQEKVIKELELRGNVNFLEDTSISAAPESNIVEEKVELEPPKTTRKVEEIPETAEDIGIRKAAIFMDRDRVTFEEWGEMGPNARKLLGLPTSKVGAQNAVENGFIELPQGKVKRETIAARMAELEPGDEIRSLRDKTKKIFGATDAEIQEGMDTGSITELDLSVLSDSGEDIFKYMQEKGLDKNSEAFDIMRSLSEWADENNKRLPYNMGFLTLQFQKAFRR
jgi:hypothetical protein